MPPRKRRKDETDGAALAVPPKRRRADAGAKVDFEGMVFCDFSKKQWSVGASVGKGGFGEIHLTTPAGSSGSDTHVMKIEPYENGPLFVELSFYHRVAKPAEIELWKKERSLSFLAVPKFISSGCDTSGKTKYRFMVMERFGEDVEKRFCLAGRKFNVKIVCQLALVLLEALEFIHEKEYVHADVKGSNILTGFANLKEVYLVDYGLAYRYCPSGVHCEYKEDPRRKHDGTIEFTSIDAHKGTNPSRRGDLEILGYCLLQWASGRLPWEDHLLDKDRVAREKIKFKSDVSGLLSACFGPKCAHTFLRQYMDSVYKLEYKEKPNYEGLKHIFTKQLASLGMKGGFGKCVDWTSSETSTKTPVKEHPSRSPKVHKQPSPKVHKQPSPKVHKQPSPKVHKKPSPKVHKQPSPKVRKQPKARRDYKKSKSVPRKKSSEECDGHTEPGDVKVPECHYPSVLGYSGSNDLPPKPKIRKSPRTKTNRKR